VFASVKTNSQDAMSCEESRSDCVGNLIFQITQTGSWAKRLPKSPGRYVRGGSSSECESEDLFQSHHTVTRRDGEKINDKKGTFPWKNKTKQWRAAQ
jgi:hypothetical protein